jgi:hypothetical protein
LTRPVTPELLNFRSVRLSGEFSVDREYISTKGGR